MEDAGAYGKEKGRGVMKQVCRDFCAAKGLHIIFVSDATAGRR